LVLRAQTNEFIDKTFKHYARYGIIGGSVLAVLAGFGGSLALISRKKKIPLGFTGIALRALGYSTLVCACFTGAIVYGTQKLLGVKNMEELNVVLREKIKPKSDAIKGMITQREVIMNPTVTEQELDEIHEISAVFDTLTQDIEE